MFTHDFKWKDQVKKQKEQRSPVLLKTNTCTYAHAHTKKRRRIQLSLAYGIIGAFYSHRLCSLFFSRFSIMDVCLFHKKQKIFLCAQGSDFQNIFRYSISQFDNFHIKKIFFLKSDISLVHSCKPISFHQSLVFYVLFCFHSVDNGNNSSAQ